MGDTDYSISFCIVCMNRLHQLKQTLIKNILDNERYPKLEFVILNYNSLDDMDKWINDEISPFIKAGRVTYYHTYEPQKFSHSHSKNVAFKLAEGDIVCNINADHFTGSDFAEYVNSSFKHNPNIVLTTIDYFKTNKNYKVSSDVFGKVCVKKKDFIKVTGFNEQMTGYGFEDWDFVNRLELAGVKRKLIENLDFLRFIRHNKDERYSLKHLTDKLSGILINYQTPSQSEVIILYNDNVFERGTLTDNSVLYSGNYHYAFLPSEIKFENSLKDNQWIVGRWTETNNNYKLTANGSSETIGLDENAQNRCFIGSNDDARFYFLTHTESIKLILEFEYTYPNRRTMERSLYEKNIVGNLNSYGKVCVYRNFVDQAILI